MVARTDVSSISTKRGMHRGNVLVGGLDQLSSGSVPTAGHVAGLELVRSADIEQVGRSGRIGQPTLDRVPGDGQYPEAVSDLCCGMFSPCPAFRGWIGRGAVGVRVHFEAGEMPTHGAVLQGHDPVLETRVDERLRADDAAGPPGAIDDDQRVRVAEDVFDAMHELGAGTIDPGRNAHSAKLVDGSGIEHHEVSADVEHLLSSGAEIRGVSNVCSIYSPNALDGTFTPA